MNLMGAKLNRIVLAEMKIVVLPEYFRNWRQSLHLTFCLVLIYFCACAVSQLGFSARYDSDTRSNIAITALSLLLLRPNFNCNKLLPLLENAQKPSFEALY